MTPNTRIGETPTAERTTSAAQHPASEEHPDWKEQSELDPHPECPFPSRIYDWHYKWIQHESPERAY